MLGHFVGKLTTCIFIQNSTRTKNNVAISPAFRTCWFYCYQKWRCLPAAQLCLWQYSFVGKASTWLQNLLMAILFSTIYNCCGTKIRYEFCPCWLHGPDSCLQLSYHIKMIRCHFQRPVTPQHHQPSFVSVSKYTICKQTCEKDC